MQVLIRCHNLQHLIWVYAVCSCLSVSTLKVNIVIIILLYKTMKAIKAANTSTLHHPLPLTRLVLSLMLALIPQCGLSVSETDNEDTSQLGKDHFWVRF